MTARVIAPWPPQPIDYSYTVLYGVLYSTHEYVEMEGDERFPIIRYAPVLRNEVISVSTSPSVAGTCPQCGEAVPSHRLLIEYETANGRSAFAECPTCEDVIHPESA